jgi:hypothetical protein
VRNKPRREALADRFRDPKDPLRIVLVRDMWLTSFDAPSLHTTVVPRFVVSISEGFRGSRLVGQACV